MSDDDNVTAYFVMVDGFWEFWTDDAQEAETHRAEQSQKYPQCEWTIQEHPMTRREFNQIVMA
jgi:hypothetical protein